MTRVYRKNSPRYQFESGTSHLRCLRLAFRERLPRRHVCGNISSSFSPPIFISLALTLSRSFACAPRVWELACVRPGSTHGRRCWCRDSRPCVGEAWTRIGCGSFASFALSAESHTTRASLYFVRPFTTFTYDGSAFTRHRAQAMPVKKRGDGTKKQREERKQREREREREGRETLRTAPCPRANVTTRPRAFKLFVSLRVDELHT